MKRKISFICMFAAAGLLIAALAAAFAGFKIRPNANLDVSGKKVLSAKEQKDRESTANDLLSKYKNARSTAEKLAIFNRLSTISDRKIIELVYMALEDSSEEVRIAAVQLLDKFDADTAIPAIAKALDDNNEEVRIIAVQALDESNVPETSKLLVIAADDESEEVRYAAFSIALSKDSCTKEAILNRTISSKYQDVKEKVIDLAIDTPSHRTVEILLGALKDGDEGLKSSIFAVFSAFFSKEFKTCDEARKWWAENRGRFDDELLGK
ncbi:MAG: HEAT repeat domain-containing protein [Victivallales bacterium]